MSTLASKSCVPCKGNVPPLKGPALAALVTELGNGWHVVDGHHLEREYSFKNFKEALAFTNKVGDIAEKEGHHPDFHLGWGFVRLSVWTHKINGLTESDFVLAAKADTAV